MSPDGHGPVILLENCLVVLDGGGSVSLEGSDWSNRIGHHEPESIPTAHVQLDYQTRCYQTKSVGENHWNQVRKQNSSGSQQGEALCTVLQMLSVADGPKVEGGDMVIYRFVCFDQHP